MSTVVQDEAIRKALASTPRPPRASAMSAALTFGWRGMLKVKHVPEQLLDVSAADSALARGGRGVEASALRRAVSWATVLMPAPPR